MKFRTFHELLTKWSVPLDTINITEELLETEMTLDKGPRVNGELQFMSVNLPTPEGTSHHWYVRFDGSHGIFFDGQIIPVYSTDGLPNPLHDLFTQSLVDLSFSAELAEVSASFGDNIDALKRFQALVDEQVVKTEEALMLAAAEAAAAEAAAAAALAEGVEGIVGEVVEGVEEPVGETVEGVTTESTETTDGTTTGGTEGTDGTGSTVEASVEEVTVSEDGTTTDSGSTDGTTTAPENSTSPETTTSTTEATTESTETTSPEAPAEPAETTTTEGTTSTPVI